jgi:hypothetical protein
VRRALSQLGKKAKPKAIQGWIKDNLHLDMTTAHISTTKGQLLRKTKKKLVTTKGAASQAPLQEAPTRAAVEVDQGTGVLLEDILTLRELLQRVGPEPLRTLIDVLSR